MKKTIKITAACFMLIATLGSCTKKGDTGATGAAGTNGTNGTNGNANVVAGTATLTASNWSWDATSKLYYCDITDNSITSDIVNSGVVLVYIQAQGSNGWNAIPTAIAVSNSESLYFNFNYEINNVEVSLQFSDQSTAASIATYNFKIICISSAQRQSHPNTNWHDYNQVKSALGSAMVETTLSTAIQ